LAGQTVASFEIGKYEVTWGEWKEVRAWALSHGYTDLADVGNTHPSGSGDNFPVIEVSYYDAVKWCNAKSEKEGKTPAYTAARWDWNSNGIITETYKTQGEGFPSIGSGNGYRLLSEKEWEWAARGGLKTHGYTYSGSNVASEVAWTSENSSGGPKAVGTKMPNELGIYDMEGNVVEWCEDYPKFTEGGLSRRFRGSSWESNSSWLSAVETPSLNYCGADQRYNGFGFRLARSSEN
jgi:formylglycine-generating enzyme required for sulfatase activity